MVISVKQALPAAGSVRARESGLEPSGLQDMPMMAIRRRGVGGDLPPLYSNTSVFADPSPTLLGLRLTRPCISPIPSANPRVKPPSRSSLRKLSSSSGPCVVTGLGGDDKSILRG